MEKGDWVVLPSKRSRTIHFGKITGDYVYDESLGSPFYHYRVVTWVEADILRDVFDQDILYSIGAFMTVCKIHKNNAEERIKQLWNNGWQPNKPIVEPDGTDADGEDYISLHNIEENMLDQISEYILRKFKDHRMEELVAAILKAKGYAVYRSPECADRGVDLLVSSGELGFGGTKICSRPPSDGSTHWYNERGRRGLWLTCILERL